MSFAIEVSFTENFFRKNISAIQDLYENSEEARDVIRFIDNVASDNETRNAVMVSIITFYHFSVTSTLSVFNLHAFHPATIICL